MASPDLYSPGDWILRKFNQEVAVKFLRAIPFPGVPCGFLVQHDGPGIPILDGDSISPCFRQEPINKTLSLRHSVSMQNKKKK